jgi:hypothetical protein
MCFAKAADMRTLACLAAASILSAVPSIALAQDPWAVPNVPDEPQIPHATVVLIPAPAPPAATPAPVWYGTPTPDPVVMRRRNPKLMVGGLVMLPIGLAMAIGGGVWAANINSQPSQCPTQQSTGGSSAGDPVGATVGAVVEGFACGLGEVGRAMGLIPAYTIAFMGGAMVVGGAVMTGVGASMVPATKPQWQPAVSVGAGSAKLTWTF